jgi:hypothetical protein
MNKKLIVSLLCVFCVFLNSCSFYKKDHVIRISEKQIQDMLNERFPYTKDYFTYINIGLNSPRVNLTDGKNRVYAGLDIDLEIAITGKLGILGGSLDISGGVEYKPEEGSFYLTDPIIENVSVRGFPRIYAKKINLALTDALGKIFEYKPIYTLKTSDAKQYLIPWG